jgi:hypothetical protein
VITILPVAVTATPRGASNFPAVVPLLPNCHWYPY